MLRPIPVRLASLSLLLMPWLTGCIAVGELRRESVTLDPQGAETVQVSVSMGAGELAIDGGLTPLVDAAFETNISSWMPRVEYRVGENALGRLSVTGDEVNGIPVGEVENEWKVTLTESLPLDLHVDLGLGEGELDLTRLQIQRVHVDVGAGELRLKLGRPTQGSDLKVSVDAGIGEIRIIVPDDVGVRVWADTGIGEVSARGFDQVGAELRNSRYDSSDTVIDISVDLGIGEVRIVEQDLEPTVQRSLAGRYEPSSSTSSTERSTPPIGFSAPQNSKELKTIASARVESG